MAEEAKTRIEILAELWAVTPEEAGKIEAERKQKRAAKAAKQAAPVVETEPPTPPEAGKKKDAVSDPA